MESSGYLSPPPSLLEQLRKTAVSIWVQQQQQTQKALVYCQLSNKISEILQLFREHNVISLPVFHEELNKFVAIVNLYHVMRYLMLKQAYSGLSSQNKPEYNESVRKEIGNVFRDTTVSEIIDSWGAYAFTVHLAKVPLLDAMQELVFKSNTYAVLVDASQLGEKAGSDMQQVFILTQHDAITYILRHIDMKEEILDVPAKQVMMRAWKTFTEKDDPNQPLYKLTSSQRRRSYMISISQAVSAMAAFKCMAIHGLSSIAIVDKEGDNVKLLSNLSASDIRYLNEDTVGYALLPVMEYLNRVHGSKREPIACNEDTPLKEVMELAVKNSVHRIWVIEKASGEVIGEVSMTDMLAMFIGVK